MKRKSVKKKSAQAKSQASPRSRSISDLREELLRATQSWVLTEGPSAGEPDAQALILGGGVKSLKALSSFGLESWQMDQVKANKQALSSFSGTRGPLWVLCLPERASYGVCRDAMGALVQQVLLHKPKSLQVHFIDGSDKVILGALVGLDVAAYGYMRVRRDEFPLKTHLSFLHNRKTLSSKIKTQATHLSRAINLGRHLVNLPPNCLYPQSYAELAQGLFKGHKGIEVEVWGLDRLRKEEMGLFVAVGEAAAKHPPCLVRIKYRPQTKSGSKALQPIALVGKGITFDSGGLNLKPAGNMRLMKKDMGGSAAVMALAYWVSLSEYTQPVDFYLALAENAVDQGAFRPSDVLTSRSGLEVEIHNTDAEGRLVLADTLDVAITQKGKDEPELVIDVATLTGAIKVALGVDLAGLFSNNEKLSKELLASSQRSQDLCWAMPLHQKYRQSMKSTVADMTNAVDGFGGAVTAALFLESFVGQKPWAHLDIYAWKDAPEGAYTEAGASGQAVQLLADFLLHRQ